MPTSEEVRLEICRRSFPDYCEYVHAWPLYRHQKVWATEMVKPGARVLVVAPPESFKSTTMRMFLEWGIGNDPETPNLLVMNTATQAQRQVMSIAETITQNIKYKKVFPWIVPNPKRGWSHEVLFVKRQNETIPDPTLYGTGIDGPYQGSHVGRLIVDDPTDQQDVRSDVTMQQQRDRLHGVLLDRLNDGGSFIAILTRWGEADLKREFEKMQDFMIMVDPVEGRYPWGRLLCPEKFGDDRLAQIRHDKGGQLYQLTYMCDPSAAEGAVLKREWWRQYSVLPEIDFSIHSWDLSTGKHNLTDYSAFLDIGRAMNGYYIKDAGRWRLGIDGIANKMKLIYESAEPRPRYVLVEEAGTSIPVIQYLREHTRVPILAIKPGVQDKVARAQGVQGLIEAQRAWLPAVAPWLTDFMDECAAFPGGQFDDWVDCLTQGLRWMDRSGKLRGRTRTVEGQMTRVPATSFARMG